MTVRYLVAEWTTISAPDRPTQHRRRQRMTYSGSLCLWAILAIRSISTHDQRIADRLTKDRLVFSLTKPSISSSEADGSTGRLDAERPSVADSSVNVPP